MERTERKRPDFSGLAIVTSSYIEAVARRLCERDGQNPDAKVRGVARRRDGTIAQDGFDFVDGAALPWFREWRLYEGKARNILRVLEA